MISVNEGNQTDAPSRVVLLHLNVECQYHTFIKSATASSNNVTCVVSVSTPAVDSFIARVVIGIGGSSFMPSQ